MANFLKCCCAYCDGHIEFPPELLNTDVSCPHCAEITTLSQSAPPPILSAHSQFQKKPSSKTAWVIAASVGGCAMFFIVLILLFGVKSPHPDRVEIELKDHLASFRETFGHGYSYDVILNNKNELVKYCRENKTSLTNYSSELDAICEDLDRGIAPSQDEVPEAEFQRRADAYMRAMDNIEILVDRLSHDNERMEVAKNWKASQDVERAARARQRGDNAVQH